MTEKKLGGGLVIPQFTVRDYSSFFLAGAYHFDRVSSACVGVDGAYDLQEHYVARRYSLSHTWKHSG